MNNILRGALFFIAGAASASLITYKVVEKKFKNIADEEIASVKEMYQRKLNKLKTETEAVVKEEVERIDETIEFVKNNPYSSLVRDLGYSNKKEGETMPIETNVEVIPPEDFGEYGYKTESLTYYVDKILTYENDEKINNVDEIVGSNALNTFGEYEDDSVFVRNHDLKTDFEILLDTRRYSDVIGFDD